MRIRLGCFGWLCLGWIIIPTWILFEAFKGLAMLLVAIANALAKHNRRRAVRKAYQRDQAAQKAAYLAGQQYAPWRYPQPWNYGNPQWQQPQAARQPEPQDTPGWQPRTW